MQIPDAPRPTLRRGLIALIACAVLGAGAALADEIEDANALLKAGQHRQALEHVNKALAAKPRDPQARFLKGVILTEQGGTKEAIEIFSKLTQDFPELPEPYNNLAVIYASQGQYEKARTALEQSIRTHPSYATAYENLGDVYAKLASQAYDKALQLDKSNTGAQNKLSLVREIARGPAPVAAAAVKEPAKPAVTAAQKPPAAVAQKPASVQEKPAPAPAPDPTAEILKTVNGWAQAWSKKDINAYLAYYAKDFKTPGGEPRAAWEKTRRARIEGAKSISVGISSAKVTLNGTHQATVSFRQAYRSDRFKANSSKTLVLEKSPDGRWQIQQEKSG
ncbi:MAG: tetratricopeptide repeat protein [Betaproteobacteria bacterium]|nr:MAG: tetratricopeptide repeat protein [Betaproteobacteria bacterium]